MKIHHTLFLLCAFFFVMHFGSAQPVQLGIDVLQKNNFDLLRGKRVGLVTNQTGVNGAGEKTRLVLKKNVHLVALYTPEHGLDGVEKAGTHVKSRRDQLTGLTAYSLYDDTRKPTPAMLAGIDVLVYDMQDIGCRSYTYISTMAKCMQACAEQHKEFVVLDRPNPIGGERVEGMPVEPRWISFVSQLPVPYVHGMTVGELAVMANEKGWTGPKANLKVVRMHGWSRAMTWQNTDLHWVRPSPNIPNAMSPFYYVITGLVSELGNGIDIGIGTDHAFQLFCAPWTKPRLLSYMRAHSPGMEVSSYQTNSGRGIAFNINASSHSANLCNTALYLLSESNRESQGKIFTHAKKDQLDIFNKVYGSSSIRQKLITQSPERIIEDWQPFLKQFRRERLPYLLYQ